jgi:hypothetical protein
MHLGSETVLASALNNGFVFRPECDRRLLPHRRAAEASTFIKRYSTRSIGGNAYERRDLR